MTHFQPDFVNNIHTNLNDKQHFTTPLLGQPGALGLFHVTQEGKVRGVFLPLGNGIAWGE